MAAAAGVGATTATAVADTLVDRGVPFRSAHHVAGRLVAAAERAGVDLTAVTDDDIRAALDASEDPGARRLADDPAIAGRLRAAATIEAALGRCDVIGGTAPHRVRTELERHESRLAPT